MTHSLKTSLYDQCVQAERSRLREAQKRRERMWNMVGDPLLAVVAAAIICGGLIFVAMLFAS